MNIWQLGSLFSLLPGRGVSRGVVLQVLWPGPLAFVYHLLGRLRPWVKNLCGSSCFFKSDICDWIFLYSKLDYLKLDCPKLDWSYELRIFWIKLYICFYPFFFLNRIFLFSRLDYTKMACPKLHSGSELMSFLDQAVKILVLVNRFSFKLDSPFFSKIWLYQNVFSKNG